MADAGDLKSPVRKGRVGSTPTSANSWPFFKWIRISRNQKFEYQNPKQIRMTKTQMFKSRQLFVLSFENLNFVFVSDFGFRASDFTGGVIER